jgi:hypothetical protein
MKGVRSKPPALARALRLALENRRDHAALCGLTTRLLKNGVQLRWRDMLAHESGALALVPHDAAPEVYGALLEELQLWRKECRA